MNNARFNTLLVRLPEGVAFSLPLAGPVTRFLAWLVDCAATLLLFNLIQWFVLPLLVISEDFAGAVATLLFFAVPILYGIGFEGFWRGQTPGKRLLRLRVADVRGLRLRFSQVVVRNLLRPVDALPGFYLVGGAACFLSRRCQRLGDLAADTVVIRVRPAPEPDLRGLLMAGKKYNSLHAHPVLSARLRSRVGPAEAAVLLGALGRREELEPSARVEIFAELAGRLRATLGGGELPEDLREGLTDEQFVRNAADVLHESKTRQGRGDEITTPRTAGWPRGSRG